MFFDHQTTTYNASDDQIGRVSDLNESEDHVHRVVGVVGGADLEGTLSLSSSLSLSLSLSPSLSLSLSLSYLKSQHPIGVVDDLVLGNAAGSGNRTNWRIEGQFDAHYAVSLHNNDQICDRIKQLEQFAYLSIFILKCVDD